MPVRVTLKGFNPLVPGDAEASGKPLAVLSYEVENLTDAPLEVSVCGSLRNFIGKDGSRFTSNWKGDFIPAGASRNRSEYRDRGGVRGIYFHSEGVDAQDPAWGTMALVTQADAAEVSWRTSSKPDDWNNAILNFWDDFSADGWLTERDQPVRFEFLDMDSAGVRVPDFQLGPGCLVDQLVGQYMAHI